jgi:dihydropteroate synthase
MPPEIRLPDGPVLMGIVNVTPDSFSDGGRYASTDLAVAHALRLVEEGAAILDIGGESTRPGALPVSQAEEQERVLPVIEALAASGCTAMISVDTRNASTMRAALNAGAGMVNDISALRHDAESLSTVRNSDCLICLMHMQGQPETMQKNPQYYNVIEEVFNFLLERISFCEKAGIARNRLVADPGIGFGKTVEHNLDLVASLGDFRKLGVPVMLGASRKGFIGRAGGEDPLSGRLAGSVACALHGLTQGCRIFRVHDVAATRQAFAVWQAIQRF